MPGNAPVNAEPLVQSLLLQFVVILAATRAVTAVARRAGQTAVVGEILAGLLLGPSCLGAFAPHTMQAIFPAATSTALTGLAQTGVLLLMFQVGQEFDFRSLASGGQTLRIVLISALGILCPFALGYLTAPFFFATLRDGTPAPETFRLFFAVAMSITALPTLGRIFLELGLSETRVAAVSIGAAAIDDVLGWLILGVVTLLTTHAFNLSSVAIRVLAFSAFVASLLLLVRPALLKWLRAHMKHFGELRPHGIAVLLFGVFTAGWLTSKLGVFAIIGAFLFGLALHEERAFVAEWRSRVAPLVNTFLVPLFFALTGLRTDLGSLVGFGEWGICALIVLVAILGKFGGVFVGARALGEPNRIALTLAAAMNTRGLMQLIVLNVGYELGVVPKSMFAKLVVMALVTTALASPLIRRLMKGERGIVDGNAGALPESRAAL